MPEEMEINSSGTKRVLMVLGFVLLALVVVSMLGSGHARADTVVSGPVSGTWDMAGSPYWVEGDITVNESDTLVIEPGVEVRFNGSYSLNVQGTLRAVGNESDKVLFTSNSSTPSTSDWNGIRIDMSSTSVVSNTIISYADIGIYISDCSPLIEENLINKCGGAIYAEWSSSSFLNNEIRENGEGLILYSSSGIVRGNTISYCMGNLILDTCLGTVVEDNVISFGLDNVIIIGYDDICSVTLSGNQIDSADSKGVLIDAYDYEVTVLSVSYTHLRAHET